MQRVVELLTKRQRNDEDPLRFPTQIGVFSINCHNTSAVCQWKRTRFVYGVIYINWLMIYVLAYNSYNTHFIKRFFVWIIRQMNTEINFISTNYNFKYNNNYNLLNVLNMNWLYTTIVECGWILSVWCKAVLNCLNHVEGCFMHFN